MLTYYYNLPKDRRLNFEGNVNVSVAIMNTARRAFSPFKKYLHNAIEALNKKEINAKWKKVTQETLAELKIIGGLYEVNNQTTIQLKNNVKGLYKILSLVEEPDFTEKLKYKSGKEKGEIEVSKDDFEKGFIRLPTEATNFDMVVWGFDSIQLQPAWIAYEIGTVFQNSRNEVHKIIFIEEDNRLVLSGTVSGKLSHYGKEMSFNIISNPTISDNQQKKVIKNRWT
jgi:hypothetical protein